jgi:predicted phage gp36 major capsid-like protein
VHCATLAQPSGHTQVVGDAEQLDRWRTAENQLRSSLNAMRSDIDVGMAKQVEEYLDHNELALAMDALVDAALDSSANAAADVVGRFLAASAAMDGYLPDRWDEFVSAVGRHS